MSASDTIEPPAAARSDGTRRWWQWLLMYPALGVALLGAVPQFTQWIGALRIGAPLNSNVAELKAQNAAWQRNARCTEQIERVKPPSPMDYTIDLLVCPSGDILLTLTPLHQPGDQVFRWILTRELFNPATHFTLIGAAQAQPLPASSPPLPRATRVLGVKKLDDQVVRRVQLSDNTCEDQTIHAYTGRLVSSRRAPCEPL